MRAPRRDAGLTISSTRPFLLGANRMAVAALTLRIPRSTLRGGDQCSGRGSNPHGSLSQGILSPSRLPISPPEQRSGRTDAGNGTRTRDPNLGKVVLYQLSYSRKRVKATGEKRRPPAPQTEREPAWTYKMKKP